MAEKLHADVEILLWDLDGTILDSLGLLHGGLEEILPDFGRAAPTRQVLAANFHGSLDDSINNSLGGVPPKELAAIIAKFLVVQDRHYEIIEDHLFPDAVDLARRAHEAGKQQIIVTNRAHEGRLRASPRHIVEHSSLRAYIDKVICGDDSQHRKPHKAVLGGLAKTYQPEATVVIGDQHVDANFAHNLGSRAVLVSRSGEDPHHLNTLGHDWRAHVAIVSSLHDVEV